MARQWALLLACLLLSGFLLSEAAKILTVSSLGMVSLTWDIFFVAQDSFMYCEINTSSECLPLLFFSFLFFFFFFYREAFDNLVKLMEQLGIQCSNLLRRSDIMDSLKNENFDLVFVEAFDFCSFLIAEKLGKPFVSILPTPFGSVDLGLPSPVSYVPVFHSLLTDCMDFWSRVKNFLMFFDFFMKQWQIQSTFDKTIKEHFPEGARPVLSHLLKKAELWFVNSDFALEFARPLLPNTVYVGGLMVRPVKPVPQVSKTVALDVDFM
ncbi:UDP-glucuronosyltransferase 3A1-like [Lycaon pictus]